MKIFTFLTLLLFLSAPCIAQTRPVRVIQTTIQRGQTGTVTVEIVTQGNENAITFNLNFDTGQLTYVPPSGSNNTLIGPGMPSGSAIIVNDAQLASGRLGILLSAPIGTAIPAGTRQILNLTFMATTSGSGSSTQVSFGNIPFAQELVDVDVNSLPVSFTSGTITLTVGSPSGRLRINDQTIETGGTVLAGVEFSSDQATKTVQYSISFDATKLTFVSALPGPSLELLTTDPAFSFAVNTSQLGSGLIGISIQLPASSAGLQIAKQHYITALKFTAGSSTGSTSLNFGDTPIARLVSGPSGAQSPVFTNGEVSILMSGIARKIRILDGVFNNFQPATMNVELEAQGNENAIAFSIFFDPTHLQYQSAVLGPDATGATLNLNLISGGQLGISLALPPSQTFPAGTRRIITLNFLALERPGPTSIYFSDSPVERELASSAAASLPAIFQSPTITFQVGLEGDVAPRPYGNGTVSLTDWVQVGRFSVGLDTPSTQFAEFQKADCAPLSTGGDGRVGLTDWVQAGRFAVGTDTPQTARGPDQPIQNLEATADDATQLNRFAQTRLLDQTRRVLLSTVTNEPSEIQFAVKLIGRGDENAIAFTLEFDPDELQFIAPALDNGAAMYVNMNERGRLGVAIALLPGKTFGTESGIVALHFMKRNRNSSPTVQFVDGAIKGEVVTVNAESAPAVFGVEATREIRRR